MDQQQQHQLQVSITKDQIQTINELLTPYNTNLRKRVSSQDSQFSSPEIRKKLNQLSQYLKSEQFDALEELKNKDKVESMISNYFGLKETDNTMRERYKQVMSKAKKLMQEQGIDYQKFKQSIQRKQDFAKMRFEQIDPKFIKPDTLLEYEKQENKHVRLLERKTSQKSIVAPKPSFDEQAYLKKKKAKLMFEQLSTEDRNRPPQELFAIVEEAKKSLDEGSITLGECYKIMKNLTDIVQGSNQEIQKMYRLAQELLFDAKCQVAIGDEDPKDANPQYSLKAFKKLIKDRNKQQKNYMKVKSNTDQNQGLLSKQNQKKEYFGTIKERETNKDSLPGTLEPIDYDKILRQLQAYREKQQNIPDNHKKNVNKVNQKEKPHYVFERRNSKLKFLSNKKSSQKQSSQQLVVDRKSQFDKIFEDIQRLQTPPVVSIPSSYNLAQDPIILSLEKNFSSPVLFGIQGLQKQALTKVANTNNQQNILRKTFMTQIKRDQNSLNSSPSRVQELRLGMLASSTESIQENQNFKVVVEKRPSQQKLLQQTLSIPNSPDSNLMNIQYFMTLKSPNNDNKESLMKQRNSLKTSSSCQRLQLFQKIPNQQQRNNNFNYPTTINSLSIRTLVPNPQSKCFPQQEKKIRNASQTYELFMKQSKKLKQPNFQVKRNILPQILSMNSLFSSPSRSIDSIE